MSDIIITNDIKYVGVNEVYNLIKNNVEAFVPNDEDYRRIFEYLKH